LASLIISALHPMDGNLYMAHLESAGKKKTLTKNKKAVRGTSCADIKQ